MTSDRQCERRVVIVVHCGDELCGLCGHRTGEGGRCTLFDRLLHGSQGWRRCQACKAAEAAGGAAQRFAAAVRDAMRRWTSGDRDGCAEAAHVCEGALREYDEETEGR